MCNFTKGPWILDEYRNLIDASGSSVLIKASIAIPMANHTAEQLANAHLIAAAPEMYEAIERIVELLAEEEAYTLEWLEMHTGRLTNLLAKARGEHV